MTEPTPTTLDAEALHAQLSDSARGLLNQATTQFVETHHVSIEDALYNIAHQALVRVFYLINLLPEEIREVIGNNPILSIPPVPQAPAVDEPEYDLDGDPDDSDVL